MRTLSALTALISVCAFPGNVAAGSATLGDFTGIWAHSAADCQAQFSGGLDEMDRATSSQYEVIGICEDGLNPLREPVECSAAQVLRKDNRVEFMSTCYVKDYPAEKRGPATIIKQGPGNDAISLTIESDNYSVYGNYVRCNKTYECQHFRVHQRGLAKSGRAAALDRDTCARNLNTVYACKTAPHCQYSSMIEWLPQNDQEYLAQIEAGTVFSTADFERLCREVYRTKVYTLRSTRATLCGY